LIDRLFIVGNSDEVHVGAHFLKAARQLGIAVQFRDSSAAFGTSAWRQKVDWWARGRRPSRLREFSADVLRDVEQLRPSHLLTTGIAPIDRDAMAAIGARGVRRLNFLTDDPWNSAHRAPWFMDALRLYDDVFSPRRANLFDLEGLGGPRVTCLRFGYAPDVHFPEAATDQERGRYEADIMFAGGADADRVALASALIGAGFRVALYGGYWQKHAATKTSWRGFVDAAGLRKAVNGAKVCLGLVRRANRDGHSMRSFEVPAMGACFLVEDTEDHRAIFGEDGSAAVFFRGVRDAVEQAGTLVEQQGRRQAMSAASHRLITSGRHTYADRLIEMLRITSEQNSEDRPDRTRTLSRV
jgi:spore maturation protein CgeB